MVAAEAQARNLQACMCNQTIEGILCPVPSSAGQCGVGVERLCSSLGYDTALVDLCAWHGWKLAQLHLDAVVGGNNILLTKLETGGSSKPARLHLLSLSLSLPPPPSPSIEQGAAPLIHT